jgi:predicted O-methyltransferase YrrM
MISFIHGRNGEAKQQFQNALVTICRRDEYYPVWEAMCRPSWEHYCALHGVDLIVVTGRLDSSERGDSRSPSWEKLLVLEEPWAQNYERVVWLGEEVVISRHAPNILRSVPDPAKVGVCASGGQMSDAERHIYMERLYNRQFPLENGLLAWRLHGQSVLEGLGLPTSTDMFSRGVFVFSPRHHAAMLRDVYEGDRDSSLHEQPFISAEIGARGLAEILSPRFGWNVHEAIELGFAERPSHPVTSKLLEQLVFVLRNEIAKAYFLDFLGSRPLLSLLYQAGIRSLEDMLPSPSLQQRAPGSSDGDYISPGLSTVRPDIHFPQMTIGNPQNCPWPYLRRDSPHNWYIDRRWPAIGFVSRDEAHILYNTALQAAGMPALEIGAFMGWSACHLALAGVDLDVIDPLLSDRAGLELVSSSLRSAGVLDRCNLIGGLSPTAVDELAQARNKRWNLIFIDGDHEGEAPHRDTEVCIKYAADDCIILFHDLYAPAVAEGLRFLHREGWPIRIYNTSQVMGVAWRGAMRPIRHVADPRLGASLPPHLQDLLEVSQA